MKTDSTDCKAYARDGCNGKPLTTLTALTARDALTGALQQIAQAFRDIETALSADTLRRLRHMRADSAPAALVLTARQPQPGAATWLVVEAIDARCRRLPLLRLPDISEEDGDDE